MSAVVSQCVGDAEEGGALGVKAAGLRRAARAGGHGPSPLPVSATAPAAPGHSARNTAKTDSQSRKQPDQPEHQDQVETR
ncbi:hypothetical protein GCM10009601_60600 [Streptomyces thermospinosisporus]|uniref:Transposase n=2 Tax=Streptomyces TaxID=1883 RepID=A0ABN1Z747_9ACTN